MQRGYTDLCPFFAHLFEVMLASKKAGSIFRLVNGSRYQYKFARKAKNNRRDPTLYSSFMVL